MISTTYHNYPELPFTASETMKLIAEGKLWPAHLENTFQPMLFDAEHNRRYSMTDEVQDYLTMNFYFKLGYTS